MNIKDKDLDEVFKNKANLEAAEPDFDESAWNILEKRLEKRDRKILFYRVSYSLILLGLLVFGLNFYLNNYQQINKNQVKLSVNHDVKDLDSLDKKIANQFVDTGKTTFQKLSRNANPDFKQTSLKEKRIIRESNLMQKEFNKPIALKSTTKKDQKVWADSNSLSPQYAVADISSSEIVDSTAFNTQNASLASAQLDATEKDQKLKKKSKIVMGFSFATGPEFNTAGSISRAQNNLNFGLAFFAIKSKVKLTLGANYGLKSYAANASQYSFTRPNLKNLVSNINAECHVLEIPLLLSYPVWKSKFNVLHLSAGLSSYFMLKERYSYEYYPSSGLNTFVLNVENRNQHYFKVVQIAADYSFPIKKRSSQLGIEPYIKLPLQGVGVGKVMLKSYGINLKYAYELSKK